MCIRDRSATVSETRRGGQESLSRGAGRPCEDGRDGGRTHTPADQKSPESLYTRRLCPDQGGVFPRAEKDDPHAGPGAAEDVYKRQGSREPLRLFIEADVE